MLHIKINEITKCSNIVANILSADPPPMSLTRPIGQDSAFSEHGHVAYPIKWNHEMQQHGSNYFACRPPPMSLTRPIGQKSTFSEHCHVAYQIKGNHECSNMETDILLADTPHPR